MKYPEFLKKVIDSKNLESLSSLKSLRIQANLIYYKYVKKGINKELSDTFDLLIMSCLPYVELFLTERSNGNLLKELKRRLSYLENLEIETMRDLRTKK